jgi:outer membrane protein OmpA-like peptidoglycan-associated protein
MKKLLLIFNLSLFICPVFTYSSQADTLKLFYNINESAITGSNSDKLIGILHSIKTDTNVSLQIRGYTDFLGSDGWNDTLSKKRAETVRSFILLHSNKIRIEHCSGKGKLPPKAGPKFGIPENRRVEVIVVRTVKIKKRTPPSSLGDIDNVKEGDKIILKNLNFYGGRHYLLPRSVPELDSLYHILWFHPSLVIEIEGYVCCTDSMHDGADFDANDMYLSVNRAKAIYDLLIERGIRASRLSYKGFGGKRPIVFPEYTDADRETNRRVEIRIIKK